MGFSEDVLDVLDQESSSRVADYLSKFLDTLSPRVKLIIVQDKASRLVLDCFICKQGDDFSFASPHFLILNVNESSSFFARNCIMRHESSRIVSELIGFESEVDERTRTRENWGFAGAIHGGGDLICFATKALIDGPGPRAAVHVGLAVHD